MEQEANTPITGQNQPPTPRLQAGALLPGDLEIIHLMGSHGNRNIYLAHDAQGTVRLLEQHGTDAPLLEKNDELEFILCGWPEVFHHGGRTYAIFPENGSTPWKSVEMPAREASLTWFLSNLLDAVGSLYEAGVDMQGIGADDIYLMDDYPHFMILPLQAAEEQNPQVLLGQLVEYLLFTNILPKITRNLDKPLRCLGFTSDMEQVLLRYLADSDAQFLREWLDQRLAQPAPYWDIQGRTHTGHIREHNEDALGWQMGMISTHQCWNQSCVVAVSDGMGGHERGEEASHIALTQFMHHCTQAGEQQGEPNAPMVESLVAQAFDEAALAVRAAFSHLEDDHRPGATLVAGYLRGRKLYLGNCGDSRAYLYHNDKLVQLTTDHSLVQLYVDRGLMTAQEGEECDNHIITAFVGMEPRGFKKDIYTFHLPPGCTLLLCSDGLTDMVKNDRIAEILAGVNSLTATDALINEALENGGHDNITVLVLKDRTAPNTDQLDGESP